MGLCSLVFLLGITSLLVAPTVQVQKTYQIHKTLPKQDQKSFTKLGQLFIDTHPQLGEVSAHV